jgi:hypothetical protein
MKAKKQDIKEAYKKAECKETKDTLKRLYPKIKFENDLAESWEEYCEMMERGIFMITVPLKYHKLYQLELLRDHYNGEWRADWMDSQMKYTLYCYENKIECSETCGSYKFLHFKTRELREKFYKNFKDLIEEARDLI